MGSDGFHSVSLSSSKPLAQRALTHDFASSPGPPGRAERVLRGNSPRLILQVNQKMPVKVCVGVTEEEEEGGRASCPLSKAPLHHLPRALGSFSRSQICCSAAAPVTRSNRHLCTVAVGTAAG